VNSTLEQAAKVYGKRSEPRRKAGPPKAGRRKELGMFWVSSKAAALTQQVCNKREGRTLSINRLFEKMFVYRGRQKCTQMCTSKGVGRN
jgi:hypothetical protein